MKVAIAGCGVMGATHAAAYRANGAEVVAVCDRDAARAEDFAHRFNCASYATLEGLFAANSPDIVSICTPAVSHLDAILRASAKKCAIVCEKPFVVSMNEARTAAKAISDAGIIFRIGFKMRYESVYAEAEKILRSGEIGALRYIFISHFQPSSEPSWYMDIGVTTELLIHSFDIAGWLFGELPRSARMTSSYELGKSGEDKSMVELDYSGGRKAIIVGGYMPGFPPIRGKHDFVFQFVGEKGYVAGKRNGSMAVFSPRRVESFVPAEVNAFEKEMTDVFRAMRGEEAGGATLEDALRSQHILEAALSSAKTGAAVNL